MANFNFTVRATDSDGAYADRNFGITINNTRVERYMVTDTTNAYTSPDLVNWTARNGFGGWDCIYGNNMWLINNLSFSAFANWIIRKSPDGVNYTNITASAMTFVTGAGAAYTVPTNIMFGRLSFSNGYFYLPFVPTYASTTPGSHYLMRSTDGVAWTVLNLPTNGGFYYSSTQGHVYRTFQRIESAGTDLFYPNIGFTGASLGTADCYGWRSADNGLTWTKVQDATGKMNNLTSIQSTFLTRINGLYIAATQQTNVPFMISNDGYNWSPCTAVSNSASVNANNIFYANGVIYAVMNGKPQGATSLANTVFTSTDGVVWVASTTGTTAANNQTGESIISSIYKNGFVAYGSYAPAAAADKRFGYVFAGSGDATVLPSSPTHNIATGPQVPFNSPTGIAAMGS